MTGWPRRPGGSRRTHRAALTLVEVLVATALFGTFAAVTAAGLVSALRLQAAAASVQARTAAFEPLILAGAAALDDVPFCAEAPDPPAGVAATVCRRTDETCRLVAGTIACDGGPLRRVRLGITGGSATRAADGGSTAAGGAGIVVWSRVAP